MSKINSLLMPFEIGDLFFTTNNTNPSNRFGGTWELYAKGKTIVGIDPDDTDFNSINKTGGEKTHTLTINEMPEHNHSMAYGTNTSSPGFGVTVAAGDGPYYTTQIIQNEGGNQAHNNLQPFIVSYIWINTA